MQVYDKVIIPRNGKESVVDRAYAIGGIKQDSRFPVPFGKGRFVRLGTEVGLFHLLKNNTKKEGKLDIVNRVIKPIVEIDDIKVEKLEKEAEKIKQKEIEAQVIQNLVIISYYILFKVIILSGKRKASTCNAYTTPCSFSEQSFLGAIIIGATVIYILKTHH